MKIYEWFNDLHYSGSPEEQAVGMLVVNIKETYGVGSLNEQECKERFKHYVEWLNSEKELKGEKDV